MPKTNKTQTTTEQANRNSEALSQLVDNAEKLAECGMVEQAAEVAKLVLSFDPANSGAYNILGFVAATDGDIERAVDFFQRADQADPTSPDAAKNLLEVYLQAGRQQEADALRERLLARFPDDIELTHQPVGPSMDDIQAMIDLDPMNVDYHLAAATLLESQGEEAKALEYYENAWELATSDTAIRDKTHELRSRLGMEAA
jgi:tetratricopeptide (TPR) repeat protein